MGLLKNIRDFKREAPDSARVPATQLFFFMHFINMIAGVFRPGGIKKMSAQRERGR